MRKIKFRGQRTDSNEWIYGYLYITKKSNPANEDVYFILNESGSFKVEPESVGQYTDLNGKNGEEIYDGDIVQSSGTMVFSNPDVQKDLIRIVKKLPSGFTLVANNNFELPSIISNISNYTFWNTQRDWVVIGNIYDKPELLEVHQ